METYSVSFTVEASLIQIWVRLLLIPLYFAPLGVAQGSFEEQALRSRRRSRGSDSNPEGK